MLVVIETVFDTKERLPRCILRRQLSPLKKCKIIRHYERYDLVYNFMKKINIVEHKPVQKGKKIDLLAFS